MKTDFKQEIFDKVAKHLLTQKVRCVDKQGCCVYFNVETNMKCAAGCLIPDRDYSEYFERGAVDYYIINKITNFFKNSGYSKNEIELVQELQELHDWFRPKTWKKRLRLIAKEHSLTSDVLKSF